MNLWRSNRWEKDAETNNKERRKSLRYRFHIDVDKEVRQACMEFGNWLRREFYFPIRVTIYFKSEPGKICLQLFMDPLVKTMSHTLGSRRETIKRC